MHISQTLNSFVRTRLLEPTFEKWKSDINMKERYIIERKIVRACC